MDLYTDTQDRDTQDRDTQNQIVFLMAQGETTTMVNGKPVDNKTINTVYDGNHMIIKGTNNGNVVFSKKMNNNDIIKLLENPANKLSLIERITKDFKINNSNTKKSVKNNKGIKQIKRGRNTRKRNTRKRNTSKRNTSKRN
jgi:hypothetical protein